MDPEQQAAGMDNYVAALQAAADAGIELTAAEQAIVDNAVKEEHAVGIIAIQDALMGLPTAEVVNDFEDLRGAWENMDPEQQAAGMDNYVAALQAAADAGIELTAAEQAIVDNAVKEEHAVGIIAIQDALMGLPTAEVVNDFEDLRGAWENMNPDEQAAGMDNYVAALQAAADAGIELTAAEVAFLDAIADGEVLREAAAAAAEYAAGVADIQRSLLGLPTDEAIADFEMLREAWEGMDPAQRATGWDAYTAALQGGLRSGRRTDGQ